MPDALAVRMGRLSGQSLLAFVLMQLAQLLLQRCMQNRPFLSCLHLRSGQQEVGRTSAALSLPERESTRTGTAASKGTISLFGLIEV